MTARPFAPVPTAQLAATLADLPTDVLREALATACGRALVIRRRRTRVARAALAEAMAEIDRMSAELARRLATTTDREDAT